MHFAGPLVTFMEGFGARGGPEQLIKMATDLPRRLLRHGAAAACQLRHRYIEPPTWTLAAEPARFASRVYGGQALAVASRRGGGSSVAERLWIARRQ